MARTKFWAGKYPWQMSSCHFMSLHAPLTLWTSFHGHHLTLLDAFISITRSFLYHIVQRTVTPTLFLVCTDGFSFRCCCRRVVFTSASSLKRCWFRQSFAYLYVDEQFLSVFRVAFSHVSWFMMSIPVFQASCSRLTTRLVITIHAMRAFGLYAARKRIWPQSIAMAACSYYINRRCHFLLESEHFEPSGRIVPVCVWRIAQRECISKDLMSFRNRHRSCFELSLMSPFARAISEYVLLPSGRNF